MGTEGDVIWRRIAAVLVDSILVGFVTSLLLSLLLPPELLPFVSVIVIAVSFGYYIYLEGAYGQTIGKMALDIVVVTEDGGAIDYKAATIRTILRIVDALPFLYLLGLALVFFTDRNQRLGDIAADTVVVRAQ